MFYPFFYNESTGELCIGNNEDPTPEGFIRILPMKSAAVEGRWRWGKDEKSMQEGFCNLIARYMPTKKQWSVFEKDYLKNKQGVKPVSAWNYKDVNSERGTEQFVALGFDKTDFPNPKPIGTIQRILKMLDDPDAIILDSFAGSGTTAHAALAMTHPQKFILVEMMDYADSITAERVKRAISGIGDRKKVPEINSGNFSYYELGEPVFRDGRLNEDLEEREIRKYVYFTETKQPLPPQKGEEPYYMGMYMDAAYYFYHEKDRITTLNRDFLHTVKTKAESYVIYADLCTLSQRELEKWHITFKKISRDIRRL